MVQLNGRLPPCRGHHVGVLPDLKERVKRASRSGAPACITLNESDGEWRYWELTDDGHVERDHPAPAGGWTPSGLFEGAAENGIGLLDGTAGLAAWSP